MEIEAPVVVNVAGPHSAQITEMALADCNDMTISTRPMRQEPGVNRSFFFVFFYLAKTQTIPRIHESYIYIKVHIPYHTWILWDRDLCVDFIKYYT